MDALTIDWYRSEQVYFRFSAGPTKKKGKKGEKEKKIVRRNQH